MPKPFEIYLGFLEGFGFSTQLDATLDPRRKKKDARYKQADGKSSQNRLINRGRRLKQTKEVSKSYLLFLVLKKKSETEEENYADQNHANHDVFPFGFGRVVRLGARSCAARANCCLIRISSASDNGPVADIRILLLPTER